MCVQVWVYLIVIFYLCTCNIDGGGVSLTGTGTTGLSTGGGTEIRAADTLDAAMGAFFGALLGDAVIYIYITFYISTSHFIYTHPILYICTSHTIYIPYYIQPILYIYIPYYIHIHPILYTSHTVYVPYNCLYKIPAPYLILDTLFTIWFLHLPDIGNFICINSHHKLLT